MVRRRIKMRMAAMAASMVLVWNGGCAVSVKEGDRRDVTAEERNGGVFAAEMDAPVGESGASLEKETQDILIFEDPGMVREEVLAQCQAYGALVESYVGSDSFGPANNERVRELTGFLSGHYEVAGRKDREGREYYVAARRTDAPEYEDLQSLSAGYFSSPDLPQEVCQIGYVSAGGDEKVLYQFPGYTWELVEGVKAFGALDQFCFIPLDTAGGKAFLSAFCERGRMELDFLKKHPGLSFVSEDQSYISCYYQDEDTIEFYSEPYVCNILLDEGHMQELEGLLEAKAQEGNGFSNDREAMEWLRQKEPSVRTTGAVLKLGDDRYALLGSRECNGYMLSYGPESVQAEYCQPVYSYVIDRIREVMGRDYGDFTDSWFDGTLTKASLEFPKLAEGDDGAWEVTVVSQTVTDPQKLKELGMLLGGAVKGREVLSGCPYKGVLNLVREDGETLQMFVAADSCDSVTYEGRIGFMYGGQEKLAEIFDEAMMSLEE